MMGIFNFVVTYKSQTDIMNSIEV